MYQSSHERYGFIKPASDAHTLGINYAAELLRDCGYEVIIAPEAIEQAMLEYKHEIKRKQVIDWIRTNCITKLGLSYRLDSYDATRMMGFLLEELKKAKLPMQDIFFAGLPQSCRMIQQEFPQVNTFIGSETIQESLAKMGVPASRIPASLYEGSQYDDFLFDFGKKIIDRQEYTFYQPVSRDIYPEFGTRQDTVVKRLQASAHSPFAPLMRAHGGPYRANASRLESVQEFLDWTETLAKSGYLDILSIGSSQLTQSHFGQNWEGLTNGGGVPIHNEEEYRMIWEQARPMLVRTYAGTRDIPDLAKMHEESINISWHALSLWWFNKLDERGPYDLYTNLKQHFNTIRYIAKTKKPFEANVSHHFAFRGADDVTYLVSGYLCAKLAKKLGIQHYILQNMLNTPRITWGIQDLAKSRALLTLIKDLEDRSFQVYLQPRAGLDYFKPDLNEAKIQLAAVTALMDDIDPHNELSPPIIHVVSYSEASHLATPEVINESIQITQHSLQAYRKLRKDGKIPDMSRNADVQQRMHDHLMKARLVINVIETTILDLYTPEGFYQIFKAGFLPAPYLWTEVDEFRHAKEWKTKPIQGGVKLVDHKGDVISQSKLVEICTANLELLANI